MAKRIVHMLNSMGMGGIENFIMNVYRKLDREKYQFDFILQCEEESYFEKEIKSMGGRIYKIPRIEKHPMKHLQLLKKILNENEYLAFHRHTANSVVFVDLWVAKKCGIQRRIVHSHSISNQGALLNKLFRQRLYKLATDRLACGKDAGIWLYGNKDFRVIKNGFDTSKYAFSEQIRNQYRDNFGLKDAIVVGHVGRFSKEKNHPFLINMFQEVYQKNPKFRLLLCGGGEYENDIKEQVHSLNLDQVVIFAGIRKDIPHVIQAMDIFAFPSFYEGLPIALIEAQMTNLPCVVSDKIPKEALYHDNIQRISIAKEDKEAWANAILNLADALTNRQEVDYNLKQDYDISHVTKELIKIYEGEREN